MLPPPPHPQTRGKQGAHYGEVKIKNFSDLNLPSNWGETVETATALVPANLERAWFQILEQSAIAS